MKTSAFAMGILLTASLSHGQPGMIWFSNQASSAGAKVLLPDGTPVTAGWRAQLYFVPEGMPLSQLYPIPGQALFKTAYEASLGYVAPQTVLVPTFPGEDLPRASGEKVTVVMRAFTGLTFEAATEFGESKPVTVILGGGDRKPVTLATLEGFTVNVTSVTRVVPASFVPGEVLGVRLAAKPTPRVKTYSVHEWAPFGWTVMDVSDGGVFDSQSGMIKWGPFSDNVARVLSYRVRSAADSPNLVQFEGESYFDTLTYPVTGTRQLQAVSRLFVTQRSPNGDVQLRLNGRPGSIYSVSASSDLIRWTPIGVVTETGGIWQFTDRGAVGERIRFYRASTP